MWCSGTLSPASSSESCAEWRCTGCRFAPAHVTMPLNPSLSQYSHHHFQKKVEVPEEVLTARTAQRELWAGIKITL